VYAVLSHRYRVSFMHILLNLPSINSIVRSQLLGCGVVVTTKTRC
jgi:hypothetical protein